MTRRVGFRGWQVVSGCAILLCGALHGQSPIQQTSGGIHIFNTDMAVLEAQEIRKDLPCTVTPEKPSLGFDLRFHAGYEVSVPLKDLSGLENQLTILFRITPDNKKDEPSYFVQHIRVPSIEDDAKGDANLSGSIDLGEGTYHVDWLMRDRGERDRFPRRGRSIRSGWRRPWRRLRCSGRGYAERNRRAHPFYCRACCEKGS